MEPQLGEQESQRQDRFVGAYVELAYSLVWTVMLGGLPRLCTLGQLGQPFIGHPQGAWRRNPGR